MISKSPSTNPTAILGMFFYNLLIYKIILIPMNKQAKNGNAIKRLTFCTPPGCFIRYFFPNIFHIIIPKTKPIIIEHTRTIKVIVIFLLVFILSTCMIIRKLIITRSFLFNIVVQYNSDTMDF